MSLILFSVHVRIIEFQSTLPSYYSTIMEYFKEEAYKSIINIGIVVGIGIIWILVPVFMSFMLVLSEFNFLKFPTKD